MEKFYPNAKATRFSQVRLAVTPKKKISVQMLARESDKNPAKAEVSSIMELDKALRAFFGNSDVDDIIKSIEKLPEFINVPWTYDYAGGK
jgi:hypothetical protein